MQKLLEKLAQVTTANVSDVQISMEVMHPHIQSVVPGTKMAGPARTVKAYPGSILTVHKALFEAQAGDVIVVDGQGDLVAGALLGEIMAQECAARGVAGVVIDGAVRDVPGLRSQGLPVFARGVTPRVGTNRRLGQTQVSISCGGVVVAPGDIVFGDDNGVVVIPQGGIAGLVSALDALQDKEQALIEGIAQGVRLAEGLGLLDLFRD